MNSRSVSSCQVKLVPLAAVRPSTYNPRVADPKRLDLIELSFRKLGFLLPIFATREGEILSGHQRHLVADRMGVKQVPVAYTRPMDLEERKAVNIVFNRGTNDLGPADQPENLTEALKRSNVMALAKKLPDRDPGSYGFYRCLYPEVVSVRELARVNSGRWKKHATNVSRTLLLKGVVMPAICTPDLVVVNGIGRVEALAARKVSTMNVVIISPDEAAFSNAMLNLLSMDFDIHTRYQDLLRHNSFRRARRVRANLGRGFTFDVLPDQPANRLDILQPADQRRWKLHYGDNVVDFGAGHLHETDLLRRAGVQVTPFEPYRLGKQDGIDKAESVALARGFLEQVRSGAWRKWTSIFISSVLNSVPFKSDREAIVRICAAVCPAQAKLYAVASSVNQTDWTSTLGACFINRKNERTIAFALEYEPGIKLGEFGTKPKVQKYHTVEEFKALFAVAFRKVIVAERSNNVEAVASMPREIDRKALRAAIALEFDLPYPDGSRMGLVEEAIDAFEKGLKVKL